ncbi:MAG: hypothetical protein ACK55I_01585 [bacterium]
MHYRIGLLPVRRQESHGLRVQVSKLQRPLVIFKAVVSVQVCLDQGAALVRLERLFRARVVPDHSVVFVVRRIYQSTVLAAHV